MIVSLDVLPPWSSMLCLCLLITWRPAIAQASPAATGGSEVADARARLDDGLQDERLSPGSDPQRAEPPRAEPQLLIPSLHALGLMTGMRATEAYLWPHPFAETSTTRIGWHYHQAFTRPPLWDWSQPLFRQDRDRWYINVVGHGAFGSELYLRARTCHQAPWQALVFTAVASASWEYGFEANGTRPSGLDLLFTPAAGLLLGEARFMGWRSARTLRRGPLRSALSALFDPFGELERALGTPC